MKKTSKRQKNTGQATKLKAQKKKSKNVSPLLYGLIAGLVAFTANYMFFINDSDLVFILSKAKLISTTLVLSAVLFYSIFKIEEQQTANILKYVFLLLLVYGILVSFIIPNKERTTDFIILYQQFATFQKILIIPSIVLGLISIWIHKENLQQIVNDLYSEKEVEKGNLSLKERILSPVKQLFSKKEIVSTSVLFVIVGISFFTLFYRLDYFDLYSDEAQVVEGAAGYYHTGEFRQWDFVKDKLKNTRKYERAFPHLFLVAQSYKIFGISTWSSRFPSAVFGVLFIIIGYFVSYYFTRSKTASLIIIFSFAFYFEYLLLFRWTRMYSVLIPAYLLMFYVVYKFLVEYSKIKALNRIQLIKKYFDFNYFMLAPFVALLFFTYYLHLNSLFILLVLLFFAFFASFWFNEKKYYLVSVFGVAVFIIAISLPEFNRFLVRFSFFGIDNSIIYDKFIVGYPFNKAVNIITLFIGFFILIISNNKKFQQKILVLYISGIISYILFSYIINYSISFRYVSFTTSLTIILIISVFYLIIKTLYNRVVKTLLVLSIIFSVVLQFNLRFNDLYVRNFASPAKPSLAFKTIVKNYQAGELIYRHWSPLLYLDDIDTSAKVLQIAHYKPRPFLEVIDTIFKYKKGWLTWHTYNSFRIDSLIQSYANSYFLKMHGKGIDSTGVELFYYDEKMLKDTTYFLQQDQFTPTANLNLKNSYSLCFWMSLGNTDNKSPIKSSTFDSQDLNIQPDTSSGVLKLFYQKDSLNTIVTDKLKDGGIHHIMWYQKAKGGTVLFGLYIDGDKIAESKSKIDTGDMLVKIKVNPQFPGYLNNILLYDFVLSKKQLQLIINNKDNNFEGNIPIGDKSFKPLYNWQKK